MFDKKKLKYFNEILLERYDPLRHNGAIEVVMPGHFAGNKILFIGQNPGLLKKSVKEDMKYFEAYKNKRFDELSKYYVDAVKSYKGTMGVFINDIYNNDWNDISLTNVFKCPFENNIIPKTVPEVEIKILEIQIKLLEPKIIITIGSIAKNTINKINLLNETILNFYHPSYLKRNGNYYDMVESYKKEVDSLLMSYV